MFQVARIPDLPRLCFVTSECIGAFRNGGVGTAVTGLVELLAGHGFPITLIFTGTCIPRDCDASKRLYAGIGVTFELLDKSDPTSGPVAGHLRAAPWYVWRQVRDRGFDVIHFNDVGGLGALCLAAKVAGIAFQDTLLCVGTHGPTRWASQLNRQPPIWPALSLVNADEELQFRWADVIWGPSQFILDWLTANVALPERPPRLLLNVLPTRRLWSADPAKFQIDPPPTIKERITEIVFFGRLEERKGLRLFLAAIEQLKESLAAREMAVTFLGRAPNGQDKHLAVTLNESIAGWQFPARIISDLGQVEAIDYLVLGSRLAVIASPSDNSPFTVVESIHHGIPFIATNVGGIPELIAPGDRDHVLIEPTVEALVVKLQAVIETGVRTVKPVQSMDAIRGRWVDFHTNWRALLPPVGTAAPDASTIRAFIEHTGSVEALVHTLASLADFLEPRLAEVIVLPRPGAEWASAERQATLPLAPIFLEDAHVARRLSAPGADLVLVMRSGATLLPDAAALFDRPLPRGVDGLLPATRLSDDDSAEIPFGNARAFRYLEYADDFGGLILSTAAIKRLESAAEPLGLLPHAGMLDLVVARGLLLPVPVIAFVKSRGDPTLPDLPLRLERLELYYPAATYDDHVAAAVGYRTFGPRSGTRAKPPATQAGTVPSPVATTPSRRRKSAAKRLKKFFRKLFKKTRSALASDRP